MIKRLIAALLLCVSLTFFAFPGTAVAQTQQANTIILDLGSASKDDITDLRYGEDKLLKRIAKAIESLKQSGEISEDAQPVIAIVKKKSERSF